MLSDTKLQVINLQNCCIWLVNLFELYDDTRTCQRQVLQLVTHFHLVPRLRMRGARPPFSYMILWNAEGQLCLSRRNKLCEYWIRDVN